MLRLLLTPEMREGVLHSGNCGFWGVSWTFSELLPETDGGGFLSLQWLLPLLTTTQLITSPCLPGPVSVRGTIWARLSVCLQECARAELFRLLRLWTPLGSLWLGARWGCGHTEANCAVGKHGRDGTPLHMLPLGILSGKKGPHLNRYLTVQASKEDVRMTHPP